MARARLRDDGLFLGIIGGAALAGSLLAAACQQGVPVNRVPPKVTLQAAPFPLSDVHVTGGPFAEASKHDVRYLLELEPDRLLHNFRKFAGLEPKGEIYGGWESMGLAGHTLGHYLTALSIHHASTGDEQFLERVNYIVDELAAVAEARGNGYIGGMPDGEEVFAKVSRGEIETERFNLNGLWAPWYTLHKIMAGLLDAHELCGNKKALNLTAGLADWSYETTKDLTDELWQKMLYCEYGGMNEVLANLYAVTAVDRYIELSRKFYDHEMLDPLARQEDRLDRFHGNTQIPKLIGLARRYELFGDEGLRSSAEFFWDRVVNHHSYATGGHGEDEHWGPPDQLGDRLGVTTQETCNTYNMLKLTRKLFSWTADGKYADFYERALYNHILGSIDPYTGRTIYFLPLKPGHFKTYCTRDNSFWCCTGSGFENHVKYNDSIYFHDGGEDLYVNLFVPSEVNWRDAGLTIRQETEFPEQSSTRLTVSTAQAREATVHIRHPWWAKGSLRIELNGEAVEGESEPGAYRAIRRNWADGDSISVTFPMRLSVEPAPGDDSRVAILYGPVVLAEAIDAEGMSDPMPYAGQQQAYGAVPTPRVSDLAANADQVSDWVEPVEGEPLTFRTKGAGRPNDVTLMPLYRIHHRRYNVYWNLYDEKEWRQVDRSRRGAERARKRLEAATIDELEFGDEEQEEAHTFSEEGSRAAAFRGRRWRDTRDSGWFAVKMKVDGGRPMRLITTRSTAGSSRWNRIDNLEFDIQVDGQRIGGAEELDPTRTLDDYDDYYETTYAIPAGLTRGKREVEVKFQSKADKHVGSVYHLRMTRGG